MRTFVPGEMRGGKLESSIGAGLLAYIQLFKGSRRNGTYVLVTMHEDSLVAPRRRGNQGIDHRQSHGSQPSNGIGFFSNPCINRNNGREEHFIVRQRPAYVFIRRPQSV